LNDHVCFGNPLGMALGAPLVPGFARLDIVDNLATDMGSLLRHMRECVLERH